ncbi:DNA repair protein RecO [Jannaschia sp. CCS1]|uniref:DNA repair protein RecO n=1 Tax=Jannaschia sp. (strain CCS1) TaxID=290400 RepID=RECO_JANSC|nr:DNA repair protein RecO [Jannaschia sp. CCS1]Q28V18.1 RecName: Full=DNA repair protein RecO; AltName: Full=Recombination protein O [Jannaschia sp. CCS1]ABD53444.1 DNA repair protein RecO [Jannaschia sp. CCS1]
MDWRADGILLAVRRHGEASAIIELFTADQGCHLGVVRGGASRKMAPLLQVGAQLDATWRARLSDHIGSYTVELVKGRAAEVMEDRVALAGLSSVCALLSFSLPERAAYPGLFARTLAVLDGLGAERWAEAYLGWEMALLTEMGFGLDLSQCAATGVTQDLAFISPRTGRAVSRAAAGEWADRLLPLSPALEGMARGPEDILAGLAVTGHFLATHLAPSLGDKPLPAARQRLIDALERQVIRGGS